MSFSGTEIFDIYDERGNAVGTASREEVHAKGWWHHTIHCWLVRKDADGRVRVLFQKRSEAKDTNPGGYDITVAGHLSAGETPREAVRELEEELGVAVPFEQLVPYGTIREEASGEVGGKRYIDREVSHVFGLVTERPPAGFTLLEEEVAGLYEADVERLLAMMRGCETSVQADGVYMSEGKVSPRSITVRTSEFVSRDYDYYIGVFEFLQGLADKSHD